MTQTEGFVLEGDRAVVVTRVFNAPRELVFKAWTEAEHLMQWFGPRSYPLSVCKVDLREGGTWHYCMRGPNGEEAWGIATYKEIVRPERLVYSDAFSDAEGAVVPPESITEIRFLAEGNKTRMVSRSEWPTAADRDKVIEMGMQEGLLETLDRLDEHFESLA